MTKAGYKVQKGLKKVVGKDPKVLILGTLPGQESISQREYYRSGKNRFWEVVFASQYPKVNCKNMNYKDKVNLLKKIHIALWDVYAEADRKEGSSSDKDIDINSGKFNNVFKFLEQNPSIEFIVFNGVAKSTKRHYTRFLEYFQNEVSAAKQRGVKIIDDFMSTSSSNGISTNDLISKWQSILNFK